MFPIVLVPVPVWYSVKKPLVLLRLCHAKTLLITVLFTDLIPNPTTLFNIS